MKQEHCARRWSSYAIEAIAVCIVVFAVAPLVGLVAFTVIFAFPIVVLRQPNDLMLAWGWFGAPLAVIGAPIAVAYASRVLLQFLKSHTSAYLPVLIAVMYPVVLITTSLGLRFFQAAQWLGERLT
jgi:hypothetical protein